MKDSIIKHALANSLLTVLYVMLVGIFFYYAPALFGSNARSPFIPIALLLLFVFSAALCGALVLGRPLLWYLDGKKKEAVTLIGYTLGILFVAAIGVFVLLAVFA